jgi:hypothetical protein
MGRVTNLLIIGFCVLPVFAVDHFTPQNCTHGPQNRACWKDGFNILSDYTNNAVIPPGKLVEVRISSYITVLFVFLMNAYSTTSHFLNRSLIPMDTKRLEWS